MPKLRHAVMAAALALAALAGQARAQTPATAPAKFGQYHPERLYPEQVVTSFYLPMRDGARLAISLHRPAKDGKPVEGKFPVIWHHTLDIQGPGARGGPVGPETRDLTTMTYNGYVVAIVARRGAGASFGTRRGYEDLTEAYDGYEVNEWLAAQPWSTGAIGMYGCSNTGEAVMHVLTVRPPHLKAAFAGCFSWNRYDGFFRGGILANWGTGPQRSLEEDMKAVPVQGDESLTLLRQAAQEHQGSTFLLDLMKSMPFRDTFSPLVMSRFWAEASPSSYADQIRQSGAALYIQAGWRDDFRREGLTAFANLPAGKRWIVIGDWLHCSNAGFDLRDEQLRFFDYWLKGIDTGLPSDEPVHYVTVGGAPGWTAAAAFPSTGAAPQTVYLGEGRGLGALGPAPAKAVSKASFEVDDGVTCPGVTINLANTTQLQPCHPTKGAASFALAPLKADTELTGHPTVDLWVSASAPDANLFAYLEDVAPDGTVHPVTDGRLKASLRKISPAPWALPAGVPWHRSYAEDAAPLPAGQPVEVKFDMLPLSYVFKAGHRIQVTVAGSDYRERERKAASPAATVTIHAGAAYPSSITLPAMRPLG